MSSGLPNLARRPFTNERPVSRLGWTLAVVAVLLVGANLWLFRGYAENARATETRLASLRASIEEENGRLEALETEIAALDLGRQNAQARFLNRRIAERTFPWSELFDRLAEVLPRGVRLVSLARVTIGEDRRRTGGAAIDPSGGSFPLQLEGVAQDGEQLLALVDALFAHPSFADPNLAQESLDGNEVRFSLSVIYRSGAGGPHGSESPAGPARAEAGR